MARILQILRIPGNYSSGADVHRLPHLMPENLKEKYMNIKGKVFKVLPTTTGTSQQGNQWEKQDFIVEYLENKAQRFPDRLLLSCMNDRIREYDLHEGDEVNINVGHRVREYQGRYFNDVYIYSFAKGGQKEPAGDANSQSTDNTATQEEKTPQTEENAEELPF